jgi:hypothetical protein
LGLLKFLRATAVLSVDDLLSLGDGASSQGANDKQLNNAKMGWIFFMKTIHLLLLSPWRRILLRLYPRSTVITKQSAIVKRQRQSTPLKSTKSSTERHKNLQRKCSPCFLLGMVFQDVGEEWTAFEAYGHAVVLDPNHWASLANFGSVLHDQLSLQDETLKAYY